MITQTFEPDKKIAFIVKNILVFEAEKNSQTVLSFFADGYPGMMYQQTENGMLVQPQNKIMPVLFIYGQTVKPVELIIQGNYKVIAFQLYPFVLKSFFNVQAETLNDNCYDVRKAKDGEKIINALANTDNIQKQIALITANLYDLFEEKKSELDFTVRKAIQIILDNGGQILVKDISEKVHVTERTFERRFLNEVGLLPKQFCQVVQFQQSLEQLKSKEYSRLTDIVYNNGYADQSHFIRVFKAYTGNTPKKFAL
jgi:AraC-like DNA-binding protein